MNKTTPPPLPKKKSEQKLVSIYLDNVAYAKGKVLVGSFGDKHGLVEEHLGPFLKEGWRVVKLHGLGGGSEALAVRGWIVVLLER